MFLYGSVRFFSFNVLITSLKPHNPLFVGGVAEWSNAPVLKTDEGESPPRVRIPAPPPQSLLAKCDQIHPLLLRVYVDEPYLGPLC